jgi:hypothetical protein
MTAAKEDGGLDRGGRRIGLCGPGVVRGDYTRQDQKQHLRLSVFICGVFFIGLLSSAPR